MNWNESEAAIGRVLQIQVLHAFATEGAYCTKVRDILSASDATKKITPPNLRKTFRQIESLLRGRERMFILFPKPSSF
ncbi:dnaJ homolog subfamily C GRV2-like [Sesamum indicum]|uniref:DnaJ homolog subfamily C GRV2-like n=1 Tax=Sesamum indicum TaxID=4182 RepID=A0A6I9UNS1_SESIN|nr:dnaJ homolog subfamily C GRV2-like [Sesamum indicum]